MNVDNVIVDGTGTIRSGWRIVIFLLAFILCSGILGTLVFSLAELLQPGDLPRLVDFGLGSLVSMVSALICGWLCGRRLERLPFRAIGASFSKGWLKHLVIGLALGGGSLALAVCLAAAFGDFRFVLNPDFSTQDIAGSVAASFVVLAFAAAFEEALFRGYMFQTLTRSGLAWVAMGLTACFFGAVHLGNPAAGRISTLDTMIAGILFGAAYLKTRDLWFPFGIHLMWNWMQGSVFGIEVSGLTELSSGSILKEVDGGPEWLTGGPYGIEGGVASTAALIITLLLIYYIPIVRADSEMLALTGGRPTASGS